ncbi:MAG: hypothetical protein DMG36_20350 [Acidobacteria bacterium]|nr:MAG: hypothetical protein DMG36_20350 [Acidobacteriota bacterium]
MKIQRASLAIAIGLCLASALRAYEWPLDTRALHEAWELGQRNDQGTGTFLAQYLKKIFGGENDPYTAEIEILTPYAQVADQSRRKTTGYSEQQAALDYQQRGNTILINIVIMVPAAYPTNGTDSRTTNAPSENNRAMRPENFWQNFQFIIKQKGKTIPLRLIRKNSISSSATVGAPAALDGANLRLQCDVKDVASVETTVEVVTPEAKTVRATFDLKKLR